MTIWFFAYTYWWDNQLETKVLTGVLMDRMNIHLSKSAELH